MKKSIIAGIVLLALGYFANTHRDDQADSTNALAASAGYQKTSSGTLRGGPRDASQPR